MQLSRSRFCTIKSIMTVVLFVLLLCSVVFGYLMLTLKSDSLENYRTMSIFVQKALDAQLQNIRRYSLFLELNATSGDAARMERRQGTVPDAFYRLSLDMLNYQSITPIVDDVFIHYPKSDLIIGNIGCYTADSYVALSDGLEVDPARSWIRAISEAPQELSIVPFPEADTLSYIRRMGPADDPAGFIVFILNVDNLVASFSHSISEDISNFQLTLLADGIPLRVESASDTLKEFLHRDLITQGQQTIMNEGSLQIHVSQSNFSNLSYITSYDLGESYRSLRLILIICIISILLIGLSAFLLSMSISSSSNKPLYDLMQQIGIAPEDQLTDEYASISRQFDRILHENSFSSSKLQTQQDNIDSLFLILLLSPVITHEEAAFQTAKRYGVMMQGQYFYSVLFSSPDDFSTRTYDRFMALLIEQNFECWAVIWQGKFVLILHADELLADADLSALVLLIREQIFSECRTSAVISPSCDTLLGVRENCYSVAEYIDQSTCSSEVVFLADVLEQDSHFQQVKEALSQKDTARISHLLDQLFQEHKCISLAHGQVYAMLFNAYCKENAIACEVLTNDGGYYWKSSFFSALPLISEQESSPVQSSQQKSVALRAKEIIDLEYTDYFLGLYKLSEKLQVSNSYLSTTFKETFGVGVVQYTNQLRIQLAKQMILSTPKSIKEIALEVGFSSDISFIRVFKRYEKQTPGKLRK